MTTPVRILMDTDIGSDIDDALALLLLLHLADVELLGVTTVYGNVELRAKIARRILQAAIVNVPVHAGIGTPMSSPLPIWHSNLEGVGLLTDEEFAAPLSEFDLGTDAPSFIADQVMSAPGEMTLVCCGALSNVAAAIALNPAVTDAIGRLVFMGAGVAYPDPIFADRDYEAEASHNVRCDVEAARRAVESPIEMTLVTNDVTTEVWWDGDSVQQLVTSQNPPETAAVGKLMDVWLKYRTSYLDCPITGTCPHDALTVAEAVYPRRFVGCCRGRVSIHRDASTTFVLDKKGPHRAAIRVDQDAFLSWLPARLIRRGE